MRGKAEFKTMDVTIGKGIGSDSQKNLMDINENIAKGFSDIDDDIETKGIVSSIKNLVSRKPAVGPAKDSLMALRQSQGEHLRKIEPDLRRYLTPGKSKFNPVEEKSFKVVQEKIESEGYSPKVAGAILADKTRKASAAAKAKNPNLRKVKGSPKEYKELSDDIKVKGLMDRSGKALRAMFKNSDLADKAAGKTVFSESVNLPKKAEKYRKAMEKTRTIALDEMNKQKGYENLDDIKVKGVAARALTGGAIGSLVGSRTKKKEDEGGGAVRGAALGAALGAASGLGARAALRANAKKIYPGIKHANEAPSEFSAMERVVSGIGSAAGGVAGGLYGRGSRSKEKGYENLDDSLKVKGVFSNFGKKLISRNGVEPNVVPDTIKAGIDRVSKFNRVQTAAKKPITAPAPNTIMANRQAEGKHLMGIKPDANAYRGAQKVSEPIKVNIGSRRPNSYDKPLTKGVKDLLIED